MQDIATLKQVKEDTLWVLSETTHRKANIREILVTHFPTRNFKSVTIGEAIKLIMRGIFSGESNTSFSILSKEDSFAVIYKILSAYPTDFTILRRSLDNPQNRIASNSYSIRSLKYFIDSVRLNQTSEKLLGSILDQFGNTKDDKIRAEELFRLVEAYQLFEQEECMFDNVGCLELVLSFLDGAASAGFSKKGVLPQAILLDKPTFFFPLEVQLWSRVAMCTNVYLSVDEDILKLVKENTTALALPPSLRYGHTIARFIENAGNKLKEIISVPPMFNEREKLVSSTFDTLEEVSFLDNEIKDICVYSCKERRDEVALALSVINTFINKGNCKASDFHIISPNLDLYYSLIQQGFLEANIEVSIPKGVSLRTTAPAAALQALMKLLLAPSLETFLTYYDNSLVLTPTPSKESVINFVEFNKDVFKKIFDTEYFRSESLNADYIIAEDSVDRPLDVISISSFFKQHGLPSDLLDNQEWALEALSCWHRIFQTCENNTSTSFRENKKQEFKDFVRNCSIIDEETKALRNAYEQNSSLEDVIHSIQKKFFKEKRSLREFLRKGDIEAPSNFFIREIMQSAQAYRCILSIFRSTTRALKFHEEVLKIKFSREGVFDKSINMLLDALDKYYFQPFIATGTKNDQVIFTELLDTRTVRDKYIIFLGATSDVFPPSGNLDAIFGTEVDNYSAHLYRQNGIADKAYEAFFLMRCLIKNNKAILVTYPQHTEKQEVSKASFVSLLERAVGGRETIFDCIKSAPTAELHNQEIQKKISLLESRYSSKFTEYDGALGLESWTDLTKEDYLKYKAIGTNTYSVSGLEVLADCPHRFYFSEALKLKPAKRPIAEETKKHLGIIVHRALQEFFKQERGEIYGCDDDEFERICKSMYAIAKKLFLESEINWESHPLFRLEKSKTLQGLKRDSESLKQGYLKAALAYQRTLLASTPKYVEYEFGKKPISPLRLENGESKIHVKGIIDRVDSSIKPNGEEGFSVWDYKTGKAATINDVDSLRSLQVPLYAATVRQNIVPYELPLRGGCIVLNRPNRSDDFIDDPVKGVVVEHLALVESGCRGERQFSEEVVSRRVQNALDSVICLDTKVRKGNFHQIEDTIHCPYCEFKQICARNEVQLINKYKGVAVAKEKQNIKSTPAYKRAVNNFTEKQITNNIRPSPEQETAADIKKSLSVVASAGSGKTFVLRNRVLRLLLSGVSIKSILAITFTEKAAQEIRVRIETAIIEVLSIKEFEGRKLSQNEINLLLDAYCNISDAQIGTIHSFAAKVISMDPELSPVAYQGVVISSGEQSDVVYQCLQHVFLTSNSVDTLLQSGISYGTLFAEVRRLVLQPRILDMLFSDVNSFDNKEVFTSMIQAIRTNRIESLVDDLKPFLMEWLHSAKMWFANKDIGKILTLEQIEHFKLIFAKVNIILNFFEFRDYGNEFILAIEEAKSLLYEHQSSAKRKSLKNNPRNYWKELKDKLSECDLSLLGNNYSKELLGLSLAKLVLQLANDARQRYKQEKSSRAQVDFDDLIYWAREMLCGEFSGYLHDRQELLQQRLKNQFTHILIDEFQDTDPFQWDILRVIAGYSSDTHSIAPSIDGENRSLFIVGDQKQAIYGFRGGDVRVFNKAREEIFSRGGREIQLSDNYRSNEEVIKFINTFFKHLFSSDFNGNRPKVSTAVMADTMNAKREGSNNFTDSNSVQMLMLPYERRSASQQSGNVREAEHNARFIKYVLKSLENGQGAYSRLNEYPAGRRIAVLTRTVSQLMTVARALESNGIHFSISHSSGFYDLGEVIQLENVLRFYNDPSDYISLVGLLRSPLVGLSDTDLAVLYNQVQGDWSKLCIDDGNKLLQGTAEDIQKLLLRWRQYKAVMTVSNFLEAVIRDSALKEVYKAVSRDEAFRNMERLIDEIRLAELNGDCNCEVSSVLDWLQKQREAGSRAPNANLEEHDVILTTIHSAKGLEFPMVIIPFLDARGHNEHDFLIGEIEGVNGDRKTLLGLKVEDDFEDYKRANTLLTETLNEAAKALKHSEERRVFYVACSRAKDYLVLSTRSLSMFKEREMCKESIYRSGNVFTWIQNIMSPDDLKQPSKWMLYDDDGEAIYVPIISFPDYQYD
jgi:ATP-dependent helicase/nuclease subunit A